MNKVEDSTGGVEGDEGEARPFASAAEMAEALAAEPLARDCAASSFGGTMTAAEMAALAEESAQSLRRRLSENISAAERKSVRLKMTSVAWLFLAEVIVGSPRT